MEIFRTKSIEQSMSDTEDPRHRLRRSLSALDLTVFGVGVIVGTGIFVLTGRVARESAGPTVALSFVIAGIVCALAALCYAEFASMLPVAGSAYTFSYATLGEFPAWIIGWDLMLELALGAAVVSVGWSGYFGSLLATLGIELPAALAGEGAVVNVPAVLIVLILTAVLVAGIKVSARVTPGSGSSSGWPSAWPSTWCTACATAAWPGRARPAGETGQPVRPVTPCTASTAPAAASSTPLPASRPR